MNERTIGFWLLLVVAAGGPVFAQIPAGLFPPPPNVRVSLPGFNDPEEVTIAVNPSNPLNLAAGANLRYYYYSTNGGLNWTQGNLSSTYGVWGDPVVTFDALGNLYYGHLSNPPSPGYWIDRIVVNRSTTGGSSWNTGVGVGFNPPTRNQDKEWLIADMTSSPHRNNIYMAWTEFDDYGSANPLDSTRILFSRSTDAGLSWGTPVRVSDRGGDCVDEDNTVEGAVPAVGPNGEVYTAWSGPLGIMFDRSTDGGVTFGPDVFVSDQPGGWDFAIPGIYRCNGMPITLCDAGDSPWRGRVYVVWSDQRNGVTDTDVFLVSSTDGGLTWGPRVRVNSDLTNTQQFFPWAALDQSTGFLYVVFYDRRNTSGNGTEVWVARSTDGGVTFTDVPVSQSVFTPTSTIFFGDYINIAAHNGRIHPIWMRMDGTSLSVWTSPYADSAAISRSTAVANGWNLVAVPVTVPDPRVTTVFPTAASQAWRYDAGSGYTATDSLTPGAAYWVRFTGAQQVSVSGLPRYRDTVALTAGWNLVGGLSEPLPAGAAQTVPPGILASAFQSFGPSGYEVAAVLDPGRGYWVKASAAGHLLLGLGEADGKPPAVPPPPPRLPGRWH
jgi:hypothetical protein